MSKLNEFLSGRCPQCGVGKVFVSRNPYNLTKMITTNKECPNCHYDFIPEVGFYWGATYVAYAITVAFSAFNFAMAALILGFMNTLAHWPYYVFGNAVLLFIFCPLFFRFSRMLWLWVAHD